MARVGITSEQVAQAADSLLGEGQQPTIKAVRERLGDTGSPNTIHKHLTAWRAARPPATAAAPELPASLAGAIAAEIERATAAARAEIEARLIQAQTEAADLAQAGEALEAEREALTEQVAALATERDTLSGKAAQQAADLDAQAQRIEREQSAAESARVELATARLRIEGDAERRAEQTAEIQRLRAALETETAARVAGEQSAAVLASQLAELRGQVEELRTVRTRLESERDQAREQAHQAQGAAREQARQMEQQSAQLTQQATEIQTLRAALTQPTAPPAGVASVDAPQFALELQPMPAEPTPPTTKKKAPARRRGQALQPGTGDSAA
jgi:colicin import membrane protein